MKKPEIATTVNTGLAMPKNSHCEQGEAISSMILFEQFKLGRHKKRVRMTAMENNRITLIKLLFFALMMAALCAAFWYYASTAHFTKGEFMGWVSGYGAYAPVIFLAAYSVGVSFGFPPTILSIIGGLVFGRGLGTALNAAGLTLGAAGAFLVSRFFLRDFIAPKLKKLSWFDEFNMGTKRNGFYYVLFVRLVPLVPFAAINYSAPLTQISFRSFFLATFIGVIPHVFVFTNAVVEAGESATHGFKMTPALVLAFALMALFIIVPLLVKRYLKNRKTY
jgi:uncharacterized membrane protein YdjX (TVP38/TMEM64 family)